MRRDLLLTGAAALVVLTATVPLQRVFLDGAWRPHAWGAAAVALVVAAAAHRLRLGVVGAAVLTAAGFVAATAAVHLHTGGWLPGRAHLAEATALWAAALNDLAHEPAPARTTPGLMMIVWTGAWWVTHGLHELLVRLRRPGPALVAAACLWGFPLAVPQPPGRTWPHAMPFLAAAALVLLLEPDPDLAARRRPAGSPRPSLAGVGLGAVAILIAGSAPTVVPGYGQEPWVNLSGKRAARGYQPIVDVSTRLTLPAPRDLLRVDAPRPLYLRLAGLDTFDGYTWRVGPAGSPSFSPDEVIAVDRTLPPEVEIRAHEPVTVTVENLSLENVFVPVPYHPLRVGGDAARSMVYSRDGTFIASSQTLDGRPALVPGLTYSVRSAVPNPRPEDLRTLTAGDYSDPGYGRWLALPRDYPELRAVADEALAAAGAATPFDTAFALQDFFRDSRRFAYSLDVPPLRDADALTRFVTTDRTGYCEYFATAMAVMLRLEGIPSRVAVGFRLGRQNESGQYVVSTDNAHAWVEVLFPGYGWIQFEPTPALPDALVPSRQDIIPQEPVGAGSPPPRGAQPASGEELPDRQPDDLPPTEPSTRPSVPAARGDVGGHDNGTQPLPWLLAAVTAGGAAFLVAQRRPGGDLTDRERILTTQRRVHSQARRYGVGRRRSETARELALRWAAEGRVDADQARRFADLAQAAAFGGLVERGAADEAERLGGQVTAGLRASVARRHRLVAPIRIPVEDAVSTGRWAATAVRHRVVGS